MELLFQDQKIQLDNRINVNLIIEKINRWLNNSYYLSYLIVDGVSVYEKLEQCLQENLENIQRIEVIAQTSQEFINDTLQTAETYLNGAVIELVTLADGFYNVPTPTHWNSFSDMLEGMQWINKVITSINQMEEKPMNWEKYLKLVATLEGELKNMEEAIGNEDYVLIADIIQYEILSVYKALQQEFNTTINSEGRCDDVN